MIRVSTLAILAVVLCGGTVACAQETGRAFEAAPTGTPAVEIIKTEANLTPDWGSDFRATLQNNSGKPIDGFVVYFRSTFRSGETHKKNILAVDRAFLWKPIGPGEVFAAVAPGKLGTKPDNPIVRVDAVVDWISFTDGTSSGPNEAHHAEILRARRQGMLQMKHYLKGIYDRNGSDSVLQELSKP